MAVKKAVKAVGKGIKKAAKSKRVRQAATDAVFGTGGLRALDKAERSLRKKLTKKKKK